MRPKTARTAPPVHQARGGPLMYTIDLTLSTIEELEQGRCPESLANYAHELLRWRRDAIRATTPRRTHD